MKGLKALTRNELQCCVHRRKTPRKTNSCICHRSKAKRFKSEHFFGCFNPNTMISPNLYASTLFHRPSSTYQKEEQNAVAVKESRSNKWVKWRKKSGRRLLPTTNARIKMATKCRWLSEKLLIFLLLSRLPVWGFAPFRKSGLGFMGFRNYKASYF